MPNRNPSNERIKRQYLTFLKEAKRQSEATVDDVANALAAFEEVMTTLYSYGHVAPQRQGEIIQAIGFPRAPEKADAEAIADAVLRRLDSRGVA